MKKLLLLFLSVASISMSAQINVMKIQEKEEPEEVVQVYDSLMSLNNLNVMQHVGQTLFVRGSWGRDGFMECFYNKPPLTFDQTREYIYKPVKSEDKKYHGMTAYDSIIGRYYLVTDVTKSNSYLYDYCLKLKDIEKGDTLYFIFKDEYTYKTDIFLTVGCYEKMKQKFIGKEFYTTFENLHLERVDNGERVALPFKAKFKCVDLSVSIGEDNNMYAIFENPKYGKIKCPMYERESIYLSDGLIPVSEYNMYVKHYGSYYTGLILRKKVVIGMTESMVKASWGEPKRINTTTGSFGVHEQWVYDYDNYVYFENGKVTAIQN